MSASKASRPAAPPLFLVSVVCCHVDSTSGVKAVDGDGRLLAVPEPLAIQLQPVSAANFGEVVVKETALRGMAEAVRLGIAYTIDGFYGEEVWPADHSRVVKLVTHEADIARSSVRGAVGGAISVVAVYSGLASPEAEMGNVVIESYSVDGSVNTRHAAYDPEHAAAELVAEFRRLYGTTPAEPDKYEPWMGSSELLLQAFFQLVDDNERLLRLLDEAYDDVDRAKDQLDQLQGLYNALYVERYKKPGGPMKAIVTHLTAALLGVVSPLADDVGDVLKAKLAPVEANAEQVIHDCGDITINVPRTGGTSTEAEQTGTDEMIERSHPGSP